MKLNKKNKIIFIIIAIILVLAFSIFAIFLINNEHSFSLIGDKEVYVEVFDEYNEEGVDSKSKVKITGEVDTSKIGEYILTYSIGKKSLTRKVIVVDKISPIITLKGDSEVTIYRGSNYQELGYEVTDNYDQDINDKVEIINNLNVDILGSYEILYKVKDSSGNETSVKRIIHVKNIEDDFSKYEQYDNRTKSFGLPQNNRGIRPDGGSISYYQNFNSYYIGKDEKIIYLTFDEGGNLVTYVDEILEILDKHNVKATFFLCENYILNNEETIKKIANNHVAGNHTVHHRSMPSLATRDNFSSFVKELTDTSAAYYQVTGEVMPKLFRYPSGEFSERTLYILNDLGYRSIFWSFFYDDWQKDVSKEYALNLMKERLHNGAIYLIHPKNKGNYEALEEFIIYAKSMGYTFDVVTNL